MTGHVEPTRVRTHGTRVTRPATPEERIEAIRAIVLTHGYAKIDGCGVDLTTAHAIVTVYDALSETNRAKYAALRVDKMARLAWKFVKIG